MLKVDFKPLKGNTAATKVVAKELQQHASELASGVINALKDIASLSYNERQLLEFVELVNPDLTNKFAGCSDADKALTMFNRIAVVGEKRIYAINTCPTGLADILSNLASTKTLFNAVKVETAKSDKAANNLTFDKYIADKKLPAAVLGIAGVTESLITEWFITLRNMQVSEGAIRDLCSRSGIDYIAPQSDAKTTQTTKTK